MALTRICRGRRGRETVALVTTPSVRAGSVRVWVVQLLPIRYMCLAGHFVVQKPCVVLHTPLPLSVTTPP